jgi:hypothetical protein
MITRAVVDCSDCLDGAHIPAGVKVLADKIDPVFFTYKNGCPAGAVPCAPQLQMFRQSSRAVLIATDAPYCAAATVKPTSLRPCKPVN